MEGRKRRIVTTRDVPPAAPERAESPAAQEISAEATDDLLCQANAPEASSESVVPVPAMEATLVTNFTHQIINPLNGVVGTLDNMIDGTTPTDKREQHLISCRATLHMAIELVRNLAYLSELATQQGRDGLKHQASNVSLAKIIMEAKTTLEGMAKQRTVHVHINNHAVQYIVKGQRDLLRQVFLNLIENGIKYSSKDTKIIISTRPQKKTGVLICEVESTGGFVRPEERLTIFERGIRGEHAKERLSSGSGIGLYICREILSLYDATIECESSAAGPTTTFRIRFPEFAEDIEETERVKNAQRD